MHKLKMTCLTQVSGPVDKTRVHLQDTRFKSCISYNIWCILNAKCVSFSIFTKSELPRFDLK